MITVNSFGQKIYGRFGNELFQYSLAKILSYINNTKFYLNPNVSFLKFFDTNSLTFQENKSYIQTKPYIEKDPFGFDAEIMLMDNIDLLGFFQNLSYLDTNLQIIYEELVPNAQLLNSAYEYIKSKSVEPEHSICIHVRRTDYKILQKIYGFLTPQYYLEVLNNYASNFKHIFIISDDINLVQKEFTKYLNFTNLTYVDRLDMHHDFYIMYLSRINIIANSTYSWWAAFLSNRYNDKEIFAPSPWINNNYNINLYPPNWRTINHINTKWSGLFK